MKTVCTVTRTRMTRRQFCIATGAAATMHADVLPGIWIEATSFANLGGWVIDQQSIDQMGSAFLLAHGNGVPVKDAVTAVEIPTAGRYFPFIRTRDWVGPWKTPHTVPELKATGSPGQFRLEINGKPLAATFGLDGAQWHWERAEAVELPAGPVEFCLKDQTGFDARCSSIYLSPTPDPPLPDSVVDVRATRSRLKGFEPENAGHFDLVVVGGGVAGICAALGAGRRGLKVALIQNRPIVGGNTSSEIRVSPGSVHSVEPYVGLGRIVAEFDWAGRTVAPEEARRFYQGDDARAKLLDAEPNITLFLSHHCYQVETEGGSLQAVYVQDLRSGVLRRITGTLFADCSGDANLGFPAGADWRMGRESKADTGEARAVDVADEQVLGSTLHWYATSGTVPATFPNIPWALPFDEARCQHVTAGSWNWETGFHLDQSTKTEITRDHMLRAIYGNWAYQKNHAADSERYQYFTLSWVGYVLGKRESRRLLGDVIYSQHDLDSGTMYPDGMIASDWGIDIHVPDPKNDLQFPGWAFRAVHQHYDKGKAPMRWLPYRSLYSRNIDNLFMAGRNSSCTHVAFAWFRNQRTTGMMGELIGMAAWLCKKHGTLPRGVYKQHLDELKSIARASSESA